MLSVVMPVLDGADTLADQLAALAAQAPPGPWELVIADNGSRDASRAIAESFADRIPGLRVVDASARRGCAAACNQGAAAAAGDAFVFCDQDDLVRPGWLAAMARALTDHDLVVGVNDFVTPGRAAGAPTAPLSPAASSAPVGPSAAQDGGARDFYGFLPWGLSCNLGVTRGAFEAVGGYDEALAGGDDVDLCWRVQLAGHGLHVEPDAVVAKSRRATARGVWRQHFGYGVHDVELFRRHRSHGMPRRLGRSVRRDAWLLVHLPDLARPSRRLSWVRVAAGQSGRLVGSLRRRTCYL